MEQVTPHLGLRSLDVPGYLASNRGRDEVPAVLGTSSGAPEKTSRAVSSLLSRVFTRNRSAVVDKLAPAKQTLTRRDFLKKMRAGAVADSPIGGLAAADVSGLLNAATQASIVQQAVKSAPNMTRRQALGGLSAAAAGYGSAVTTAANAVAPAFRSSSPLGAWRGVSGTSPDLALARALGVAGVRRKARGVQAGYKLAKNPLDDPMGHLTQMAVASPRGAAWVAQTALTKTL